MVEISFYKTKSLSAASGIGAHSYWITFTIGTDKGETVDVTTYFENVDVYLDACKRLGIVHNLGVKS